MSDTHPAILITGVVCTLLILFLVSFGLACSAYEMDSEKYSYLKVYQEKAVEMKLCR